MYVGKMLIGKFCGNKKQKDKKYKKLFRPRMLIYAPPL
jgi:hypothetical protein